MKQLMILTWLFLCLPLMTARAADQWEGRTIYYVAIGIYDNLDEAKEAYVNMPDIFDYSQVYEAIYKGKTIYIMCITCLDSRAKALEVARDTNAFIGYFLAWVWPHKGLARCAYMPENDVEEMNQPFQPR